MTHFIDNLKDVKIGLRHYQVRITDKNAMILMFPHLAVGASMLFLHNGWYFLLGISWYIALVALFLPEILQLCNFLGRFSDVKISLKSKIVRSFFLGVLWGGFPFLAYHFDGPDNLIQVIAVDLFLMGGTTIAFFALPILGISYFVPAVGSTLLYLFSYGLGTYTLTVLMFLLPCHVMFLAAGALYSRYYVTNAVKRIVDCEKDNVISLLLTSSDGHDLSEWLWDIDTGGHLKTVPKVLVEATGWSRSQLKNTPLVDVLRALGANPSLLSHLQATLKNRDPIQGLDISVTIDEVSAFWRLSSRPIFDVNDQFIGHLVYVMDTTSDVMAEEERARLALSDPLTGMMNRARFSEEIERATTKLERFGSSFAVMFLDLDKFKLVNDLRGHLVGDKLLKAVADRIHDSVRTTDAVARLGGDEFAIILHEDCDAGAAAKLAGRLLRTVSRKYEIDGECHNIGISIGIALAPQNGTQPNQLLRNADLALYRSKSDGRGVFRFFESQMDADQREKRLLELELREAIEDNQFELFYQPLVSASSGMAVGMEALIRWNHPIRGRISPDEFMPIAEQNSIIQEIGNWTLREACAQALEWDDNIKVSVNISAQQFIGSDIVQFTKQALEDTKFPPERLEMEVTESLLINNADEAAQILKSLKELGVSIVLDDFGTGYSSLSYILKFPFDKIKIDRSFVMASSEDDAACAILKMIGGLGEQLGIRITAEGVETGEQVKILQSINCDEFQGFLFARPLRKEDLPGFFLRQYELSKGENALAEILRSNQPPEKIESAS